MFKTFSSLADANVTHYNEHPVAHTIILIGYAAAVLYGARYLARREAEKNHTYTSGQFAK